MTPCALTATTQAIRDFPCFNISAAAACSAQNPIPHGKSIQSPVNTWPSGVSIADPTLPTEQDSLGAKFIAADFA